MRIIFALLILSALAYGAWYYTGNRTLTLPISSINNQSSVLGSNITNQFELTKTKLEQLTTKSNSPIINTAVENISSNLKKIPEDQLKKLEYNYCKDIVEEYENRP